MVRRLFGTESSTAVDAIGAGSEIRTNIDTGAELAIHIGFGNKESQYHDYAIEQHTSESSHESPLQGSVDSGISDSLNARGGIRALENTLAQIRLAQPLETWLPYLENEIKIRRDEFSCQFFSDLARLFDPYPVLCQGDSYSHRYALRSSPHR